MSLAYPKSARVRSKTDWKIFFKHAKSHDVQAFRFYFVSDCQTTKLGIVAKKAIFSKAVDRNRFKRLQREYFRKNKDRLANYQIVVVAKKLKISDDSYMLRSKLTADSWECFIRLINTHTTQTH